MREPATVVEIRPHVRLLHGMRRPANWLQLVRFGLVGGVGFVVNVAVYALCVHGAGVDYHVANVVAWLVAVLNNFVLNRHWTFDAADGRAHAQAVRFLLVSLVAEVLSLLLLTAVRGVRRRRQGARPGARGGVLDAAQLPRQQALELPARRAPARAFRAAAGAAPRRSERHGLGTYTLTSPSRRIFVQEMVIYGVSFDMVGKQPIVLLKTVDGNKFLPIWIGHPEAASILMKLQGAGTPRPMTHDLLCDILGELDVQCTQVSVTELRENTFFASITLSVGGRELEIDSRPSDAIALAVRAGAPIYAAEEVISESAIEFEHDVEDSEDVVEKFKEFLDRVSPEDFAAGDS